MYEDEAAQIRDAVGDDLVDIEHVGSTAIPRMPAKPIIDILASVSTWHRFAAIVQRLAAIGYLYTPESEADDPARKVFRKGPSDMASMRTHHLHARTRTATTGVASSAFVTSSARTHPMPTTTYG